MNRLVSAFLGALLTAALAAQSPLVTTFGNGLAGLPGGALYFDLTVHAPAITLTRLDLELAGTGTVEVWTRQGTRSGFQALAPGWTLARAAPVVAAAPGVPAVVPLAPLELPQGTHGIAVRGIGLVQIASLGTGANQHVGNAHVSLHAGEETVALFVPPVISARVPHVAVHYLVGELVAMPPHGTTLNTGSRGFHFTAATDFNIRQLALPPEARQPGDTASYLVRINGAVAFRSIGNAAISGAGIAGAVDVNVHVRAGDAVDVLGNWTPAVAGASSARVSTGPLVPWPATIAGVPHLCERVGWSWDVGDPQWTPNGATGAYLPPGTPGFGRVLMTTEPGAVTATNTSIGGGCNAVTGSCYELMSAAAFDLQNQAVRFTRQPGGGYVVTRFGAMLPVGATGPMHTLSIGPDHEMTVPFTTGSFPGWTGMTIASNGFVSRAPGNGASSQPHVATMLNAPQEAFWSWHDYDPSFLGGGGGIVVEQSPSLTVITWNGVRDQGSTSPAASTVQFQLFADGSAGIVWGTMSGLGGPHLVGYSPGGPSPMTGPTDFVGLPIGLPPVGLTLAAVELLPTTLTGVTPPIVGTDWRLQVTDIPATGVFGIDVLGLSDPGIGDLAGVGMPGCGLRCSLDLLEPWFVAGPVRQRSFFVPNATALRGSNVFATTVLFQSPPPNAFGATTSNAIRGRIGDR